METCQNDAPQVGALFCGATLPHGLEARVKRKRSYDGDGEGDDGMTSFNQSRRPRNAVEEGMADQQPPNVLKCIELRVFLVRQFSNCLGLNPGGGPNTFSIEIGGITSDLFALLAGQSPCFGMTADGELSVRKGTCHILNVTDLNLIRKQIPGGFLRPSPSCVLKYNSAKMVLCVSGYTEFSYSWSRI